MSTKRAARNNNNNEVIYLSLYFLFFGVTSKLLNRL